MLTWSEYSAWRRTKCPAPAADDIEEQVHALLEFLGEVAELGLHLMERGFGGPDQLSRSRIIDECGDVFFCGCWVLDAYGSTDLWRLPRLDLLDSDRVGPISGYGDIEQLKSDLLIAFFAAGLLANNMKKRRYHGVFIDSSDETYRIVCVFAVLDRFLHRLDSSVLEALLKNQEKLERRYPDGFSHGGGIREG